eukprot:1086525-Pelagomonas_calceolata.AAC.1
MQAASRCACCPPHSLHLWCQGKPLAVAAACRGSETFRRLLHLIQGQAACTTQGYDDEMQTNDETLVGQPMTKPLFLMLLMAPGLFLILLMAPGLFLMLLMAPGSAVLFASQHQEGTSEGSIVSDAEKLAKLALH